MKKKKSLVWAWVVILFILLSGGVSYGDSNVTGGSLKCVIVCPPSLRPVYKMLGREFMRQYPGINVELFFMLAHRYLSEEQQFIVENIGPDVMTLPSEVVWSREVRGGTGGLLNLDAYVADDNYDVDDFLSVALPLKNEIYGIPFVGGPEGLYMNLDILEELDVDEDISDKDDLMDAVSELYEKGSRTNVGYYTISDPLLRWVDAISWIWRDGCTLFTPALDACALSGKRAVDLMSDLLLSKQEGSFPFPPHSADDVDAFLTGKMAFMLTSPLYIVPELLARKDLSDKIKLVPVPEGDKSNITAYKGLSFVIWSGTTKPHIAWKFISFMASEEVMRVLALHGCMPTRKSVLQSRYFALRKNVPYMSVLASMLKHARSLPRIPFLGPGRTSMASIWQQFRDTLAEGGDLATALGDLCERINQGLGFFRQVFHEKHRCFDGLPQYVEKGCIQYDTYKNTLVKTLVLRLDRKMKVLSTLEGMKNVSVVANSYIPPSFWSVSHKERGEYTTGVLETLGLEKNEVAMLMTGADMDNVALGRSAHEDMQVWCFATAGAGGNAQRAGEDSGDYIEGTINIIVFANRYLTDRAMSRAVITITEAKTAVLQDLDIRSSYTPAFNPATGTGTDNIVVLSGVGQSIDLAGGHCKMGELIAKAVRQAVTRALKYQNNFYPGRPVAGRLYKRGLTTEKFVEAVRVQLPASKWNPIMESHIEISLLQALSEPEVCRLVVAAMSMADVESRGLVPVPSIAFQGKSLGPERLNLGMEIAVAIGGKSASVIFNDFRSAGVPFYHQLHPMFKHIIRGVVSGLAARISNEK